MSYKEPFNAVQDFESAKHSYTVAATASPPTNITANLTDRKKIVGYKVCNLSATYKVYLQPRNNNSTAATTNHLTSSLGAADILLPYEAITIPASGGIAIWAVADASCTVTCIPILR